MYAPEIASSSLPGQFVNVRTVNSWDPLLRRPLSLNRICRDSGTISTLYKVVGRGTSLLALAVVGDLIDVLGPLGNGFSLNSACKHAILLGGGIGVAPLFPLAQELTQRGVMVTCALGARSSTDLMEYEELTNLGCDVLLATDDGTAGFAGSVGELLKRKLPTLNADIVFACGPNPMLAHTKITCQEMGIPLQISLEAHMACGLGVCLGCTCQMGDGSGFHHVCTDGPVFWAEEVKF